ncbi:MAG: hypothetical protein COB09_12510 [Thalassobium sp.]|nr:MAG: hypothetical protein COB09_12510 [Thalassobium sp.]
MKLHCTYIVHLALLLFPVLFSGCAINQAPEVPTISNDYRPSGREQFTLFEIPDEFKQYGYTYFCTVISLHQCFNENTLSEQDGRGLKGYFISQKPLKTYDDGVAAYAVMLSNGRKMYFISDRSKGGRYGKDTYIEPLFFEKLSRYPIYEGSSIMVIGRVYGSEKEKLKLSTGEEVLAETLDAISKVARRFSSSAVADLLVGSDDIRIETDRVEGITYVKPFYYSNKSSYQIYLGYNDERYFFRVKVKYYGDSWIFADRITISADEFRWRSESIPFKRDHHADVWEWIDIPLDDHFVNFSYRLSESEFSVVRFNGEKYYSDLELTNRERENIVLMLKLKLIIESDGIKNEK